MQGPLGASRGALPVWEVAERRGLASGCASAGFAENTVVRPIPATRASFPWLQPRSARAARIWGEYRDVAWNLEGLGAMPPDVHRAPRLAPRRASPAKARRSNSSLSSSLSVRPLSGCDNHGAKGRSTEVLQTRSWPPSLKASRCVELF